jgi:hypothetical protein
VYASSQPPPSFQFDPYLQLSYFIGFMGVTEGRHPHRVAEKFRDMYGTALITNWKVWPLAQVRTDPN